MSRGQEAQVLSTAEQQNTTAANNAQQSYNQAQGGVADYEDQLSKFAVANPYGAGGAYQTGQNKIFAGTADAAAQAAGQAMQGQAVRTGQNAGSAIAAANSTQQQNERTLSDQEAQANAARIQNQAGYNAETLKAAEVPAQLETALSGQQLTAGNESLGTAQKAGMDPSFMDTLGDSFAGAFGKGLAGDANGAIQAGLKAFGA